MPAPGPNRKNSRPRRAHSVPLGEARSNMNGIATKMIGNKTASFRPLSSRSANRTGSARPGRRMSPRNMIGSVEASAAPKIAAAAGARPRSNQAMPATIAAVRSVPGPKTKKARRPLRRTSARLRLTASVNRTKTKLNVATTATIGDCKVTLSNPSPAGPSAAPSARKTATCGRSLRSMRPERSAAMIMTRPTRAKVTTKKCGIKISMHCFVDSREILGLNLGTASKITAGPLRVQVRLALEVAFPKVVSIRLEFRSYISPLTGHTLHGELLPLCYLDSRAIGGPMKRLRFWLAGIALYLLASPALAKEVVIVTSFPKELFETYKKTFEGKHPGITVVINSKQTNAGVTYLRETKAKPEADIFWVSAPDAFQTLESDGLLDKYAPPKDIMTRIPAKIGSFPIHDPDGKYSGFAISGYGLMWNKNYLQAQKLPAPKEWTDLTIGHTAASGS